MDEMAPAGDEDDGDEAAKAFEALRKSIDRRNTATTTELKTIRKGVETLFDQIEALQAKPDYAADLAQLKHIGVVVAKRLEALEASPALKQGINAFERAGTELVKTSAQALDQKAQRLDYAASVLERITNNINDRHIHTQYVAIAGGAGMVVGVLLLLFLPRLLPFDADSHVAAAIMGKSRWDERPDMSFSIRRLYDMAWPWRSRCAGPGCISVDMRQRACRPFMTRLRRCRKGLPPHAGHP